MQLFVHMLCWIDALLLNVQDWWNICHNIIKTLTAKVHPKAVLVRFVIDILLSRSPKFEVHSAPVAPEPRSLLPSEHQRSRHYNISYLLINLKCALSLTNHLCLQTPAVLNPKTKRKNMAIVRICAKYYKLVNIHLWQAKLKLRLFDNMMNNI